MSDQRAMDRAMTLAEIAPDPSVTVGLLAGQEGAFPDSRLSRPPVTYLENTEAPAYALTNAKKGIGLGTKRNTTSPAENKGTVALVSGRRTLCLVGGPDKDEVVEIPHESVAEVAYNRGWLAHRFVLKTPRRQYHVWASRGTEESVLSGAAEFVRERLDETPEEIETDDGANRLTYRGQPVSPENHPGVTAGQGGSADPDARADSGSDSDGSDARADSGSDSDGSDAGGGPETGSESSGGPSRTLTYRGREVSPENHPGISVDDSGPAGVDREAAATDGGDERNQSTDQHRDAE